MSGAPRAIALRPSRSHRVAVREIEYHVAEWGAPRAPAVWMLHGWMDVAASFQFLVDALERDWRVLAPDWQGFGLTDRRPGGYWFYDYIGDLEALIGQFTPGERARLVGHSLGANVALSYAGARPDRVACVVALDGFGIPGEGPERAPGKLAAWLDALSAPVSLKDYDSLEAVADRLQQNNGRLTRERAAYLASHWAEVGADGRTRLRADPRHKLPFPIVYRMEEVFATWRAIAAPVLGVSASESHIGKWLAPGRDRTAEIESRLAHIPHARLVTIPEAGHMLHHDQPEAVARAIEPFLAATT